ncbi:MAG: glycosyltransferase family 4 protein [Chthonomonadales bacterium]|nr:glycosyltransferase family 4 protein [Chthonomonadales bacterium]
MRIGIDGRALTGRFTGDRTYWLNLTRDHIEASDDGDNEYVVYTRLPMPEGALPPSPRVTVRSIPASNDRIWTLATFPKALRQDHIDVAHTQYSTPLRAPCPVITTVHDISFRLYPEWFPRKHRILLNLSVPVAMRRAARVITDSMSSRRDILRVYRLPIEHVEAIPLAAAPAYRPVARDQARDHVRQRFGLEEPYVVSVGVLQPRKNLPMLVEAFARAVQASAIPHRLVLAGKRGWAYDEIVVQAARLRVSDRLLLTDYIEDAELPFLYSAADMMAFPSLYEGFGLPPLEAMACGAPTVVSDAPAMPEVAGEGALVLPVMDATAWSDAIVVLAESKAERARWSCAGLERSRAFSWATTGALTRRVYAEVAARSHSSSDPTPPPA